MTKINIFACTAGSIKIIIIFLQIVGVFHSLKIYIFSANECQITLKKLRLVSILLAFLPVPQRVPQSFMFGIFVATSSSNQFPIWVKNEWRGLRFFFKNFKLNCRYSSYYYSHTFINAVSKVHILREYFSSSLHVTTCNI